MALERITYVNHHGVSVDFGDRAGLWANENDLRNFGLTVTTLNERISGFTTGVVEKKLPVLVIADNAADLKDKLYEVTQPDVEDLEYGKLYINGYYVRCYVTGMTFESYTASDRYTEASLTITTDEPMWIKERSISLARRDETESSPFLDLNYDFPYDYTKHYVDLPITNEAFRACPFMMVIYGPVNAPQVTIGTHTYQVGTSVASGEYLTIDAINKTIILTKTDGTKVNCFDDRSRTNYIFQNIPVGVSSVLRSGNFGVDLTLYEQRRVPAWI